MDSIDYAFLSALIVAVVAAAIIVSLLCEKKKLKQEVDKLSASKAKVDLKLAQAQREAKDRMDLMFRQACQAFKEKFNQDNAHLLSQALINSSATTLQGRIRDAVEKKFNRTSQEFIGNMSDDAENLIRDLNIELCEKIWDSFQGYKELAKENLHIFPDGCKLAYTKNHRSVIVIEQKPSVRSVSFDSQLVKSVAVANEAQSQTDYGYRFSLAFPYVYFVVVFDHGKYAYHELYFRNKPMTSAREHIYLAPLPNVHRDKETHKPVCMGSDFNEAVRLELTIARQCEMVVSDFWQRTFSNDLGNGDHEKIDTRIKNYAVWQANTEKDPLFVLSVNWPKGKTIKGVVEAILDQRKQDGNLDALDAVIRLKLEQGVAKLTQRIRHEIHQAKSKGLSQFDLDQAANALLEETVLRHTEQVFEQCAKQT